MTISAAGDKEKVEKRRALGRGLESLLPGPRPVQSPPFAKGAKDGAPTSVAVSGGQQIPPSGRNDNVGGRNDKPLDEPVGRGDAIEGTIRAVVESPVEMESVEAAELRSGGQPGAAVPTFDSSTQGSEDSITIYAQAESRMPGNLVVNLALEQIDKNPFQTRYVDDDDSLEELAESIKAEWSGAADSGASGGRGCGRSHPDPGRAAVACVVKKAGKTTISGDGVASYRCSKRRRSRSLKTCSARI